MAGLTKAAAKTIGLTVMLAAALMIVARNAKAVETPLIFPLPQQMQVTSSSFAMDEEVTIAIPENASENDIRLARLLVKEMSNFYGVALTVHRMNTLPVKRKVIIMGTLRNTLVEQYCRENNMELSEENPGPEGYLLHVDSRLIVISGWRDAGAFYGLQSLRQLLRAGNGKTVQGVEISDWPALPFRAIRLYVPGPENTAFFKRFLSDFMALYKYNKVIIEFNCMRLDRHPEVNTGWLRFVNYMQYSRSNATEGPRGEEKNSSHYDAGDGYIVEKEAVREIVNCARENFLEVIPEIPSLTHAYYLLANHHELAEYPDDPWPDTYCPSNPDSYKLMFDVYDEYMELIRPSMVQIGHDEWWGSPIGVCPNCRGKDYSVLFANDVNKIHDYFAQKGIKIGMWGDYLLESVREKGTQKRTSSTGVKYETPGAMPPQLVMDMIPKDILIFNWFWGDESKERQLDSMGFTQVYGNFTPNINNWQQRIKNVLVAGGAPSSWTSTTEFNFGKDLMLDYLGCANLMWSGKNFRQEELAPVVWKLIPSIRTALKGKKIPSAEGNAAEAVDISGALNLSKNSKVFDVNLSNLKTGTIQTGSKYFDLALRNSSTPGVVGVCVKGNGKCQLPNRSKPVPIHEDVSSLIFLHAAALPAGNQKAYFNVPNNFDSPDLLGWYEIIYEDGFKDIVPIQYGVNILEWNPGGEKSLDTLEGETGAPQKAYCYEADAVNCSANDSVPVFFAYEWVNKRFGKKVEEVILAGSDGYQALQQDYGKVVTKPMNSNAVFLAAISKVKKREPIKPHR